MIQQWPPIWWALGNRSITMKKNQEQDRLRMKNSTRPNTHFRSIVLFRSMNIKNNRSKVRDDHAPCPPPLLVHLSSLEVDMDQSELCLVYSVRWPAWSGFNLVHWRLTQISLKPIYINLSNCHK